MGKLASGPDMLDCLMYLAQLDKQAGLFSTILLLPDGSVIAPHVTFNILSTHTRGELLSGQGFMTIYDGFPAQQHRTFEGALYRAIMEHDKAWSATQWDLITGK